MTRTGRIAFMVALITMACWTHGEQSSASPGDSVLRGDGQATSLDSTHSEMVLNTLVWFTDSMKADSTLSPEMRTAMEGYRRRSAAYRPKKRTSTLAEFPMIAPVWEQYERRLAAVSDDRNAPALAQSYVDSLQPPYEWEGFHDGPVAEAQFADRYQAAHPGGPFSAYLPLLAAHRWRCAEEVYAGEGDTAGTARSHVDYLRSISVAVTSADPLVRAAALRLQQRPACLRKRR